MRKLKIGYLIALSTFALIIGIGVNAIDVNCKSPVWRKKAICKDKIKSSRKFRFVC